MENEVSKNKENVKNNLISSFQFLLLNCVFIFKMDFFRPHWIGLLSCVAISVFHVEYLEYWHLIKLLYLGLNLPSC